MKYLKLFPYLMVFSYLVYSCIKRPNYADSIIVLSLCGLCICIDLFEKKYSDKSPESLSEADKLQEELRIQNMKMSLKQAQLQAAKLDAQVARETSQGAKDERKIYF